MPFSTTWSLVFRTKSWHHSGWPRFLCNVKIYEYQSQEVSSCLQNRLGTKKSWNLPNRINMNHCIIVLSLYLRFMYAVIAWNTCWLQKEMSHDLIQFSMSFKVLLHIINSSNAWWRKEACGKGIGDDLLAHLLLSRSKRKLRIFGKWWMARRDPCSGTFELDQD